MHSDPCWMSDPWRPQSIVTVPCCAGALARGDGAAFLRFPTSTYREKIWDHAAGSLVVTEAGGRISDALGAPLDFGEGRYLDSARGGIIAAAPRLHARLVAAATAHLRADRQAGNQS